MSMFEDGDLVRVVAAQNHKVQEFMYGKIGAVRYVHEGNAYVQRIIRHPAGGVQAWLPQDHLRRLDPDGCTDEELATIAYWRLTS